MQAMQKQKIALKKVLVLYTDHAASATSKFLAPWRS